MRTAQLQRALAHVEAEHANLSARTDRAAADTRAAIALARLGDGK
jgi:hypothetical protein